MKRVFFIFFVIILLGFAPRIRAFYTIPWSGSSGYLATDPTSSFTCNPGTGPASWCSDLANNLTYLRDNTTSLATLPRIFPANLTYGTDGYMVGIPFDAIESDIGNNKLIQYPDIPMGNVPISSCNIDQQCKNYFGVSCAAPTTYWGYSRQPSATGNRIGECRFTDASTGGAAYWEYIASGLPITICEFGVPLGNRRCPDLPNITGPTSVSSGASAAISWTTENTKIPFTSTDFISSCTVTSPVVTWSGLSGNESVTLNSATTFTLTCTNAFGKTYVKSVTVDVAPAVADLTASIPVPDVSNTNTIGTPQTFSSTITNAKAAQTQQFSGTYDPDGAGGVAAQDVTNLATWSVSSGATYASVNSSGLASCKASGTATISSTYSGISSTATLICE